MTQALLIDRDAVASASVKPPVQAHIRTRLANTGDGWPGIEALPAPPAVKSTRPFTISERALIAKVRGFMPTAQLLEVLNSRMFADLGPAATPYTIKQLSDEIAAAAGGEVVPSDQGLDWRALRKLLAQARRDGLLDLITAQTIDDFAVVFALNAKQVLTLKEIVLQAAEEQQA